MVKEQERRYFVELDDDMTAPSWTEPPEMMAIETPSALFIKSALESPKQSEFVDFPKSSTEITTKVEFVSDNGNLISAELDRSHLIGNGRYSKVYLAIMRDNSESKGIFIALKVCHDDVESIQEGQNEALILKRLQGQPNIIQLYDTITTSEGEACPFKFALILQFAEGGSLADRIFPGRPTIDQLFSWSKDLFTAMESLEFIRVLHLDIKPHNIFLHEGRLFLGDFGSALHIPADRLEARTRGTLSYTAPELLEPSTLDTVIPLSDTKVNIYSAGVTLYTMITGREPFADFDRPGVALIIAVRHGFSAGYYNPWMHSNNSGVIYSLLCATVLECVNSNPDGRPTARQVLNKLQSS